MNHNLAREDFFITVKNEKLFGRWIKHGTELQFPVLIFLHEGLGSIPQWKDFPEQVARQTGLDILLYERTGYGQSTPLTKKRGLDYLHLEALQLTELIRTLEIPSYFLLGHSEGGSIALIHASENQVGLKGVITLSANVFFEEKIAKGILKARQKFREDNSKLRKALEQFQKDRTDQIFYAWSDTWSAKFFQKFNLEEWLKRIKFGILAIHGSEDEYTSVEQMNRIRKFARGPVKAVVLEACGHHPHFQQRDKVLEYIVQFLSDVAPSKDR